MIQKLSSIEEYQGFIDEFIKDPLFSDPHFSYDKDNLWRALHKDNQSVLGVFREQQMIGLFVFLIIKSEKYAEMIVGLSRERIAYEEIFQYIRALCCSFSADFVFNPRNYLIRSVLQEYGAEFQAEQQTMIWKKECAYKRKNHILPYSDQYRKQYLAMHTKDVYWTGEKVIAAADRFRVLLAVKDDELVGYLDATHCFAVNELYDLRIKDHFKGQGYEQELLIAAVEQNKPNGFTVMVDTDDVDEIAVYQSVGFERVDHLDSVTAHMIDL